MGQAAYGLSLIHICKDELDTGLRQLLNLGHTAGHAFEKLSGYTLSHGSAVAMGIAVMAESCKNAGICSAGCCDKTISLSLIHIWHISEAPAIFPAPQ